MRFSFLGIALSMGLAAFAELAHAENPTITREWQVSSIGVGFDNTISINCASPTVGATNSWNAVGADFYFQLDTFNRHPKVSLQADAFNKKNITIQRSEIIQGPNDIMTTTLPPDPAGVGNIVNADTHVNTSLLDQGVFFCSVGEIVPADKIDWESTVLHELGHAIGFIQDVNEPTCAMHYSMAHGQKKRVLCAAEKQEYITVYGKRLKILSIPNVTGPQQVNIPAKVFYEGVGKFPITRETVNTSCPSGWSCGPYNGNYPSSTPSPLTFNFLCYNSDNMPTATFGWRTTLIDADGVRTNSVSHTSTCTKPTGALGATPGNKPKGVNRIIITD